jgi:hypothetical protein
MPDPTPDQTPTLLLCRDLMFVSKVTATARALNQPLRVIRDPAQLPTEGRHLIVDLALDNALDAATRWKTQTNGHVTAFAPHVDTATIQAARAANLDAVLPRSKFTADLEQILQR